MKTEEKRVRQYVAAFNKGLCKRGGWCNHKTHRAVVIVGLGRFGKEYYMTMVLR